jgi:hypothetical protein
MRIWDLPPEVLCRYHLLGEHRELHAIWAILSKGKKGYANHPETLRWKGKLRALYERHEAQVKEMIRRGYRHQSPLDAAQASGDVEQKEYKDSPQKQMNLLIERGCGCLSRES